MKTEHREGENTTVPRPGIPKRVQVVGALLGFSAFTVLLWPLSLPGLNGSVLFAVALALGTAVGPLAARYAWRSTR